MSLQNRLLRFTLCIAAIVCGWYLPAPSQQDTGATLTEIGADTTLAKPKSCVKQWRNWAKEPEAITFERLKKVETPYGAHIIGWTFDSQIRKIGLDRSA
jgi:hypothetical protein